MQHALSTDALPLDREDLMLQGQGLAQYWIWLVCGGGVVERHATAAVGSMRGQSCVELIF